MFMNKFKKCDLCPRKCLVDRTIKPGICGMMDKMVVAKAYKHMWEEPPISGVSGSGTIFFSGCNLKCIFCQNHEISTKLVGQEISVDDLANICLNLEKDGAHNINLVTPTHFVPLIVEGIKLARKKGLKIPIVYNTSGYELVDTIKLLDGIIDIYLPDFKYYDDTFLDGKASLLSESTEETTKSKGEKERFVAMFNYYRTLRYLTDESFEDERKKASFHERLQYYYEDLCLSIAQMTGYDSAYIVYHEKGEDSELVTRSGYYFKDRSDFRDQFSSVKFRQKCWMRCVY